MTVPWPTPQLAPTSRWTDEIRHDRIGRLPGEHCCLKLVWAVLDRASTGWRGFTMTPAGLRLLADLRRSLHDPPARLPQRNSDVHTETGVAPTDSVAIA